VQQASATLLAELGQSLRSMADNLERKFNLASTVVADISLTIDESLNNVATGMEIFAGDMTE
jgi:hypothetical protein